MSPAKIRADAGTAALSAWRAFGDETPRDALATAVRYSLQLLAEQYPGAAVEVRVPPFGAVQCMSGPQHTRGTPANVVEMSPQVWLELASGSRTWADVVSIHQVSASGTRATLEGVLPLSGIHQ